MTVNGKRVSIEYFLPLHHSVVTFYRPYWMTETFIIAQGQGQCSKINSMNFKVVQ